MKKILSCILIAAMLLTTAIPACAASDNAPQTAEPILPIVFVTGIGQLWSHLLDENGNYKLEKNKKGEWVPIEYNLFYADPEVFKQPKTVLTFANALFQLVSSLLLDHNFLSKETFNAGIAALLNRNIIDENGDLPSDVESPARNYPLSEYSAVDKFNFFRSIPCKDQLRDIGEENVYCYYHSAFSFLERDADGLDAFINDVVLKDRPDVSQVVLIPMSMGAAVVSNYLARYGSKGQVKRVVSIVGAWNGSDLIADLIEGKYGEDAPELLYHTLFPQIMKKPWGDLLCILFYACSKQTLRDMINTFVSSFVQTLALRTPSLLALIPAERYPAIEQAYLSGDDYADVRRQTRAYYEAQRTLPQRMAQLEREGTTFYFLCGYGLGFGEAGNDFAYFRFMQSAASTNSDEIIPISSTAPGATFAPAGQSLGRTGAYISPDGSVDLSTSFAPDRTWLFYRQKHELDYNNTALRLAMDIATGSVTDVVSSADKYPQFNERRDVKDLIWRDNTLRDRLQRFIDEHADDPQQADQVVRAQDALDKCNAMLENTHNDPESDDAVVAYAHQVLDEIEPQPQKKWTERAKENAENALLDLLARILRQWHERLYEKNGAAGGRRLKRIFS